MCRRDIQKKRTDGGNSNRFLKANDSIRRETMVKILKELRISNIEVIEELKYLGVIGQLKK